MNKLAIVLGPLALPTQLVVLVLCALIASAVGWWAGRRQHAGIAATLLDMLLAAFVAARLAFVVLWLDQYRGTPWAVFDIRDGGFTPWAGLAAAGLVAAWQCSRREALRRPLTLGLLAGGLGWLAAPGALRFGVDPTIADLGAVALVTPQGHSQSLAELAGGKPMVLNLWATWCPPCRREMPVLAAAQRDIGGVSFVFANQGEDAVTTERYLVESRLELGNVVLDRGKQLGQKYGSMALPTTLFYDRSGLLVGTHLGALSAASLASKLERLQHPG